ncbi:hypothetical protein SteCoe_36892 [Stentor coeruleus]|uniref:Uncharacterized protein n=1 Tax=Stentor coeruleus TaxID=5963 RepID=A0A1R2AP54_9CILI|nr:hypothetical protein SteCoe_36892 [Stentor coeruleus]
MESFLIQIFVGIILIILGLLGIWFWFPQDLEEKQILKGLSMAPIELNNILETKNMVQYHLKWAKHSGDTERVDQLQFELAEIDLKISQMNK